MTVFFGASGFVLVSAIARFPRLDVGLKFVPVVVAGVYRVQER
jgi:hypothetical protein